MTCYDLKGLIIHRNNAQGCRSNHTSISLFYCKMGTKKLLCRTVNHFYLILCINIAAISKPVRWHERKNCNQLPLYTETLWYTECPRRKGPNFGRVFLRSNYTDITQNTYIQSSMVTEILAREVWNFDSYYSLIDYQIHIETGRNMWFL